MYCRWSACFPILDSESPFRYWLATLNTSKPKAYEIHGCVRQAASVTVQVLW